MSHSNPVNPSAPKRIALVLANPGVSSITKSPVGFWWSELTHPYFEFSEKGYTVELFSPSGGACIGDALSDPRDASGYSSHDLISAGFIATPKLQELVANTRRIADCDSKQFDAIVVAGGQSPLFTFGSGDGDALVKKFVEFYESGKVAAALCHGVALLRYAKLSNGEHLVKGKTVTGFANLEEDVGDAFMWNAGYLPKGTHVMPWRIEDELKKLDANYIQAGAWRAFAVRDGNLVTGQQNFSGRATAEAVIKALGE